jgi:hypothetical protein
MYGPTALAYNELLGTDLRKKGLLKSQGESRSARIGPRLKRTFKHADKGEVEVELQVRHDTAKPMVPVAAATDACIQILMLSVVLLLHSLQWSG